MNPELDVLENDPFGYLDDLRDSWTDPDLAGGGSEAAIAASRLTQAQGRCALFGIEMGELGRPLPSGSALVAVGELARQLETWRHEAETLGKRWDEAIDPAEGDELCARLLKFRMDIWAIQVSAYRAYLADANPDLAGALDQLEGAADQFDEALEAQADILSTLTGTNLLKNWRASLAPEYRESLPWWLDGSLEEVARRLRQRADRTLHILAASTESSSAAVAEEHRLRLSPPNETTAWSWLETPQMMAASGTSRPPVHHYRDWRSGDGTATLVAVPGQGPSVRVNFKRQGKAARDLADQKAFLGGVPATIDKDGNADFDVGRLHQARVEGRRDCLAVGDPTAEWEPIPPEGNKP